MSPAETSVAANCTLTCLTRAKHTCTHTTKAFLLVNTSHSAGPSCTVNHRFIQALRRHKEMERLVASLHTFFCYFLVHYSDWSRLPCFIAPIEHRFRDMSVKVKQAACRSRSVVCMRLILKTLRVTQAMLTLLAEGTQSLLVYQILVSQMAGEILLSGRTFARQFSDALWQHFSTSIS